MTCDLFIFAGEKSGDLHGEKLIEALLKERPSLSISGVGGPLMRTQRMECVLPMEEFQVMGFIDVFLALPRLRRLFYFVADTILRLNPQIVITIDYPGFNLRLARHLKRKGFQGKLVHFICPSVWAWGKKRIPFMAKTLDLLLCILPFEPALFADTPLQTRFVGHPLSERLASYNYKTLPFPSDKKILALFPGSRKKEIERNLPLMLDACLLEQKKGRDFRIVLSVSEERLRPLIESMLQRPQYKYLNPTLIDSSFSYELMKAAHLAIAKSGTVTLELAFHCTPTVVIYAVSFLDRIIAYHLLRIRLPFYCLVNIIAKKEVFPELFGPHLTLTSLEKNIDTLLQAPRRKLIQKECQALVITLSSKRTAEEAASAICALIT